ncbi:MAG: hypothetical protein IT581_05440 [Verrucomicrobiales bacterium]|nr:hypothetical protein [Verrucomicrobiales bacterium]
MSDLFLDLRRPSERTTAIAAEAAMAGAISGIRTTSFDLADGLITVGRVDRWDLWGPYQTPDRTLTVVLGGRVALSASEWREADHQPGEGGQACKAIAQLYRREGAACLARFSGNFAIFIHDATAHQGVLATDRFGVFLAYALTSPASGPVLGGHPDVVARLAGVQNQLDATSLAEFVASGRLTYPFSFYEKVRALDFGRPYRFQLGAGAKSTAPVEEQPFVEWRPKIDATTTEDELAGALGHAFKDAVHRRSLPHLGRVAVGLSGGLDSRVMLASADGGAEVLAFSLLDKENEEWRIAKMLADAAGVRIYPVRRDYDYYGRNAAEGVAIYGGTGCLMSNHYLGIREALKELQVENLITGCYCDYLFKGLAVNLQEHPLTRRERVSPFQFEFYRPEYAVRPDLKARIDERRAARFPFQAGALLDEAGWWEVERRRVFPLAYEADLAQRVLPQRSLPWFVPIADNAILDVYLRLPSRWKLNSRLFRRMVTKVCPPALSAIPDNNTGAPVTAGRFAVMVHRYHSALLNRIRKKVKPGIATRGSWPNWEYYVQNSQIVDALWANPRPDTTALLVDVLGQNPFPAAKTEHKGGMTERFLRMLTLKLWHERALLGAEGPRFPATEPSPLACAN